MCIVEVNRTVSLASVPLRFRLRKHLHACVKGYRGVGQDDNYCLSVCACACVHPHVPIRH